MNGDDRGSVPPGAGAPGRDDGRPAAAGPPHAPGPTLSEPVGDDAALHESPLAAERFRTMVSMVLAGGVTVSAVVVAIGFVLGVAAGWRTSLLGGAPGPSDLGDFSEMLPGLAVLRPVAITQLGLLLLLATPVVRVAASVVGFALERDRVYVAITLVVLAILLGSIFLVR